MNRASEFVSNTPFLTICLFVINIGVFVFDYVLTLNTNSLTFNPNAIIYDWEFYRVFTSAFLHGGIMHIGMNMMSLVGLGGSLEPAHGTLRFLWITWLSIILAGFNYIFLSWLTSIVLNDSSYLFSNSIGYSGVLFTYAVIESFHSVETSRSIFGLFSVPTKLYPLILLIILQVILPNISLFGHLGGLLAGVMMMSRLGSDMFMPTQACFEWMEASVVPNFIKRQSSYRLVTNKELVHSYFELSDSSRMCCGGLCTSICGMIMMIVGFIGQILYTILFVIGCPVDRCSAVMTNSVNSIKGCGSNIAAGFSSLMQRVYDGLVALCTGRWLYTAQGYEMVQVQSTDNSNADVEAQQQFPEPSEEQPRHQQEAPAPVVAAKNKESARSLAAMAAAKRYAVTNPMQQQQVQQQQGGQRPPNKSAQQNT